MTKNAEQWLQKAMQNDPTYQELLEKLLALEPEYRRILNFSFRYYCGNNSLIAANR